MWSFATDFFHLSWWFQGSSTLSHVSVLHSSLCPNNVPLYGYATFYLFIRQLMDVGFFHFLVIMKNAALKVQGFVWMYVFIFLECIYLGGELLGHMVTVWVTFWVTARLFSEAPTTVFRFHQDLPVLAHHSCSSLNITWFHLYEFLEHTELISTARNQSNGCLWEEGRGCFLGEGNVLHL